MKTSIVAEIGINHNGDMEIIKKLIDVAVDAGCGYVKFQKRDIESCYTKEQLNSYRESPWGNTFKEQKEGLELINRDYAEIDNYCMEKHIQWFASPWDIKSIEFLKDFSHPYFLKIPSAKITDMEFLKKCAETDKLLILSTGMSDLSMVQNAVDTIEEAGGFLQYILACTSSYPCPIEDINLNQLLILEKGFIDHKIGYSDHSGSILFPSASVVLGAEMVEVHITLSRHMYGSDQAASLEPQGLRKLVKYIRALEEGLGETKKIIMPSEFPIIKKLRGE